MKDEQFEEMQKIENTIQKKKPSFLKAAALTT